MSLRSIYREVRDLVKLAEDAPLGVIRVDAVAKMLESSAWYYERSERLGQAQALRQFSADLQEWAGAQQRNTDLSLNFYPRESIFLP